MGLSHVGVGADQNPDFPNVNRVPPDLQIRLGQILGDGLTSEIYFFKSSWAFYMLFESSLLNYLHHIQFPHCCGYPPPPTFADIPTVVDTFISVIFWDTCNKLK